MHFFKITPFIQLYEGELGEALAVFKLVLTIRTILVEFIRRSRIKLNRYV
jgi:hypothetical protein